MQNDMPRWGRAAVSLLSDVALQRADTRTDSYRREDLDEEIVSVLRERRIDGLYLGSEHGQAAHQRLYDRLWNIQRRALIRAAEALHGAGIDFLVFKGAEFIERYFGSRAMSMLYDIDILIEREDVGSLKVALNGAGFSQSIFDLDRKGFHSRDVSEVARMELAHYELAPFAICEAIALPDDELAIAREYNQFPIWVVDDTAYAVVEIDVHHMLSMDIGPKELFVGKRASAFAGNYAPSAEDHLWFTSSRFYTETAIHGKRSLRDLAYMVALLRDESIDWERILKAAATHEIAPALFYPLATIKALSSALVPSEVLHALGHIQGKSLRDWGWLTPQLFGYRQALVLSNPRPQQ